MENTNESVTYTAKAAITTIKSIPFGQPYKGHKGTSKSLIEGVS